MELVDAGFSVSTGEICAVVRGTREQVGKVEFACMASGAFVEVNIIELVTLDDMAEMMLGASQLLGNISRPTWMKSTACFSTNDRERDLERRV